MTAPAGSPFGFGPIETNTHLGSPLTSTPGVIEYGLGNLSGAWGIFTPTATTNIAYLVFKGFNNPIDDWYFSGIGITVEAATPTGAAILTTGGSRLLTDFIAVPLTGPEPSSAILLGLGLLSGFGFSRRRAV